MVKKIRGRGSRYGVRYGKSIREKVSRSEGAIQKSTKSPFCNKNTVRRLSSGLWQCKKTGIKFTGKAYTFERKELIPQKKVARHEYVEIEDEAEA